MKPTSKKFIYRYLIITGFIVNLLLIIGSQFILHKYDMSFTYLVNKVSYKLSNKYPELKTYLTPQKESYSRNFPSIKHWNGQGASVYLSQIDVNYNEFGVPLASSENTTSLPLNPTILVKTAVELLGALKKAKPGDKIELLPGIYNLNKRTVPVGKGGLLDTPIIVYAKKLGSVKIRLNTLEGFFINTPYWVFQNLEITGTCKNHSKCEHAFHIVGKGDAIIIRNNIISDFNAPIKGNAQKSNKKWDTSDFVLIENNTFTNSAGRNTSNPVTTIDVVAGSGWHIKANLISDFIKLKGDKTSYAAFLKGGSVDGIFEQNLVICSMHLNGNEYIQLGLSFGGGGTGKQFFQTKHSDYEHNNGVIKNNIIINCPNDVGIYINAGKDTKIFNNILYNTLGIDVRYPVTSALVANNILSGTIRARDNAQLINLNNTANISKNFFSKSLFEQWYSAAEKANFQIKEGQDNDFPVTEKYVDYDFCNNKRSNITAIGAISSNCNPSNMH